MIPDSTLIRLSNALYRAGRKLQAWSDRVDDILHARAYTRSVADWIVRGSKREAENKAWEVRQSAIVEPRKQAVTIIRTHRERLSRQN